MMINTCIRILNKTRLINSVEQYYIILPVWQVSLCVTVSCVRRPETFRILKISMVTQLALIVTFYINCIQLECD